MFSESPPIFALVYIDGALNLPRHEVDLSVAIFPVQRRQRRYLAG